MHAGSSNMAVTEVVLLSGFEADMETLDELLINNENVKRYEINRNVVVFYIDEVIYSLVFGFRVRYSLLAKAYVTMETTKKWILDCYAKYQSYKKVWQRTADGRAQAPPQHPILLAATV